MAIFTQNVKNEPGAIARQAPMGQKIQIFRRISNGKGWNTFRFLRRIFVSHWPKTSGWQLLSLIIHRSAEMTMIKYSKHHQQRKSQKSRFREQNQSYIRSGFIKMRVILEGCLLNNVGELCLNSAFEDGADSMKNDPAEMRPAWNLYTGRFLDQLRFVNEFQKPVRLAVVVFRSRCKCSRIHVSCGRRTFLNQTIHASSKNNFRSKWCCLCPAPGFSGFSFLRSSVFHFFGFRFVLSSSLCLCLFVFLCFCCNSCLRSAALF